MLRDDVELFAGLHADLAQRRAVVRASALVFRQLMAYDLARQGRIQWLSTALGLAGVARHRRALVSVGRLFGRGLGARNKALCLIEEQILLRNNSGLTLGCEQPACELVELLLEEVALGAHDAQLTCQSLVASSGVCLQANRLGQRLPQRGDFIERGHLNHCRQLSAMRPVI